jgi:hypothetical protein
MMGWRNVKMDIRYVPRRDEYERQLDETHWARESVFQLKYLEKT